MNKAVHHCVSELFNFLNFSQNSRSWFIRREMYTFFSAVRAHSGNRPATVPPVIGFRCRSVSVATQPCCFCCLKMTDSNIERKVYVALVGLLRFIMLIQNTGRYGGEGVLVRRSEVRISIPKWGNKKCH